MKKIIVKNYQCNYFEIEGIASTAHRDSYNETIAQQGINLSYLKTRGIALDFEHGDTIGKITEAKITNEGLWVKARVYWNTPYSKFIFDNLSNPSPLEETIKFSVEIEDPIYSKDDASIITGGKLHAIAIIGFFKQAANQYTYAQLLKSLNEPWLEEYLLQKAQQDPIFRIDLLIALLDDC